MKYLLILAALMLILPMPANSEPVMQTQHEGVRVVLFSDECKLKGEITNLPRKAEWHEGGKVYEGCWGIRPEARIVLFYFSDRTVGVAPMDAFVRVTGV